MVTHEELKNSPRKFLSMTSLKVEEFAILLPFFTEAYRATLSETHTYAGRARQRKAGGGNRSRLETIEDKLLFILVYKKTYPLQTAHGLMFGMSQSQANETVEKHDFTRSKYTSWRNQHDYSVTPVFSTKTPPGLFKTLVISH